jgi:hypothetical protein
VSLASHKSQIYQTYQNRMITLILIYSLLLKIKFKLNPSHTFKFRCPSNCWRHLCYGPFFT